MTSTGIGPPPITLAPRQAALRRAAFHLLLRAPDPVSPQRLAAELGQDLDTVVADLDLLDRVGRIRRTPGGDVLASLGLTLLPTRHRIAVGTTERHTWCALDALGILGALATDGWIDSEPPCGGGRIHIDVRGGVPMGHPESYVLFIAEQTPVASVVDQWCPLVNFFPDSESARAWATGTGAGGRTLGLTEAAQYATRLWRPLIDVAARSCDASEAT
ncbi:organomercurial lyase [Nonomuraea candida]|uniref:organomercurial lyase n=1 Tax=Nonomuraea candida TaxID=359159 RepID=UPI000693DA76|nr:organomercurial lyase [Nonomuraea candida]